MQGIRKKINLAFLVVIGLYVMIGSLLYFFQERMLFLPTSLSEDYQYHFEQPFEELSLSPEPGVKINALHFKSDTISKGLVLYSHGNAGDLSRWGSIAAYFTKYNYDVVVWDYRGYGKSTGALSEQAIYNDAQYLYDYFKQQYDVDKIVLYGRSLGSAATSFLAAHNPSQQVILETPFYSIPDVAQHRFPVYPIQKLIKYEFPNYKFLKELNAPVTIIHGTKDRIVPIASALKLKKQINEKIDFVTIKNGTHNNLAAFEEFHDAIKNRLN
jgi:pimeloyl-ACP methyl ester carboxylesterase